VSAYEEIRLDVLRRLESGRVDPTDPIALGAVVVTAVDAYERVVAVDGGFALRDPEEMRARVQGSISGWGHVDQVLDRPDVEEVFIEGGSVRYIGGDGILRALEHPTSEEENRHLVTRLLAETDRHLDTASPMVQARVLGGTARLTAVVPPVADRLSATIRRYSVRRQSLDGLVELGSLGPDAAGFLAAVMASDASVVVSGQPGAGKTTMLSALIDACPPAACIRACEEVRELHVPVVHGSYYEARPPGLDGSGEVTLRALVKLVLAMRPDRIVVGEVRGAEAFELTRAVNAGCGFACTVHANSARDALDALVNAALMAGEQVTESIVRKVFASCLDLVVHLERRTGPEGRIERRVAEVLAVVPSLTDSFSTESIFRRDEPGAPLRWTGAIPPERLSLRLERSRAGVDVRRLLEGRVVA
jgi:pilus assembly protein CpaF